MGTRHVTEEVVDVGAERPRSLATVTLQLPPD